MFKVFEVFKVIAPVSPIIYFKCDLQLQMNPQNEIHVQFELGHRANKMGTIASMQHMKLRSSVKRKPAHNRNHNEPVPNELHPLGMRKKLKINHNRLHLTDINDDCLQSIFEYLTLEDLVHVAEANWRFIASARAVYARNYRERKIFLNIGIVRFHEKNCTEIRKDLAIPFFRHFGEKVVNLFVNFLNHTNTEIEQALLQHCTATINTLELIVCNMNTFRSINKPFENVRELTITKSSLGQHLSLLDIWFPNLIELHLINIKPFNPVSFEVKFHQLKHLAIYNEKMTIPLTAITQMVRLNPQIKWFCLHCNYDVNCLRSIATNLQHLEELELWSPDDRFASFGKQMMHFESVISFSLIAPIYRRREFVVNMPFAFQRLEQLILIGFNKFEGHLMSFIVQNKGIKRLYLMPTIDDWDDLTYDDLTMIIEALPNLCTLKFCADTFTIEELIDILSIHKKLKNVQFSFIEVPVCTDLFDRTEKEWHMSIYFDDNKEAACVKLNRKE